MRRIFGEALLDEPAKPVDGRFFRLPLLRVESKDGLPLEFSVRMDSEEELPITEVEIGETGCVPLQAVTDIGRGDTKLGLSVLALQASFLNFRNIRPGSVNPLMEECVIPFYGGKDRFDAAMGVA